MGLVAYGERILNDDPHRAREMSPIGKWADQGFTRVESITYLILGVLLCIALVKGLMDAATQLLDSVRVYGDTVSLVFAIDRLLLVLMLVEILHTVGVSFRSHALSAEPFLVVGLIASIRRMLVVTLESSYLGDVSRSSTDGQALLHGSMLELVVLGFLILIMVTGIVLLRRTRSGTTG
jgi:phosphate starvation-inducible membrane PsiE